jgi:4'-phosphopantetheinyl transferase EntD
MATGSTLLTAVLPSGVTAVDAVGDPPEGPLLPGEEQVVAHAVARRAREFTGARLCARSALGRLGARPAPLLPGPAGEPLWPAGFVGSLTHCEGYCAAAVARRTTCRAVGIDAEPHLALPPGVAAQATLPWERNRIAAMPGQVCWDRLVFSAKESVFKAWFPLTGSWLGFDEALVEPRPHDPKDPTAGDLVVQLLVAPERRPSCWPPVVTGAYAVRGGLVLTALTLA